MTQQCFYINLDRAQARRQALESNIAGIHQGTWSFERVPAVDGAALSPLPPGRLSPAEIGCILSHCLALERAAALPKPSLILEDDCQFHPQSLAVLDHFLANRDTGNWELLYTDVCIPNPDDMVKLFQFRQRLVSGQGSEQQVTLQKLDLRKFNFVAASAYLVTPLAAARLARTFRALARQDSPYDIVVRQLVHGGQLRAQVLFPFLTTVSAQANQSNIQPDGHKLTDASWNDFRRMMWIGAVADGSASHRRQALPPDFIDSRASVFADLLAVCLSQRFVHK